jgi:hypothetical protein
LLVAKNQQDMKIPSISVNIIEIFQCDKFGLRHQHKLIRIILEIGWFLLKNAAQQTFLSPAVCGDKLGNVAGGDRADGGLHHVDHSVARLNVGFFHLHAVNRHSLLQSNENREYLHLSWMTMCKDSARLS